MSLPRITVVTPSYNQASYLESTIRSVISQDYPNLQYLVLDGGSNDGSAEIIKRYDSNIDYWVSEPDNGQSDAIARGFDMADGELICWVNSDDMLTSGTLHAFAEAFETDPELALVAGGSVLIDADDQLLLRSALGPRFYWTRGVFTFNDLLYKRVHFLQPATMWRKSAYEAAGGLDRSLQFCFDRDLFLRLSLHGKCLGLDKISAYYRIHEQSKTSRLQAVRHQEDAILLSRYLGKPSATQHGTANRAWSMLRNRCRNITHAINYRLGRYGDLSKLTSPANG